MAWSEDESLDLGGAGGGAATMLPISAEDRDRPDAAITGSTTSAAPAARRTAAAPSDQRPPTTDRATQPAEPGRAPATREDKSKKPARVTLRALWE